MRKTIIFLCHGNICRSVAAEFVFKDLLAKEGRDNEFRVLSRGVSSEELGNDIYAPMKRALKDAGIPFDTHSATRISPEDYHKADAIFYMDNSNLEVATFQIPDTKRIYHPVYEYTSSISEIEDPWYSGRYEYALSQILICSKDLLKNIDNLV